MHTYNLCLHGGALAGGGLVRDAGYRIRWYSWIGLAPRTRHMFHADSISHHINYIAFTGSFQSDISILGLNHQPFTVPP